MNKHLIFVRKFHAALLFSQADPASDQIMSDLEIIRYQALLMETGSETLKAIKAGDLTEILLGLVDLAYVALAALAIQGKDVIDQTISWRLDGHVTSVMQILTDMISQCAAGSADKYSRLYCLCIHLARGFLNADFNKAFQIIHLNNITRAAMGDSFYSDSENHLKLKLQKAPDLSECFYE